jgi:hypothetical protein
MNSRSHYSLMTLNCPKFAATSAVKHWIRWKAWDTACVEHFTTSVYTVSLAWTLTSPVTCCVSAQANHSSYPVTCQDNGVIVTHRYHDRIVVANIRSIVGNPQWRLQHLSNGGGAVVGPHPSLGVHCLAYLSGE